MNITDTTSAAHEVGNSRVVEVGVRVGYVVVGLLHLLIAWLAVKIAWGIGGGSESADASGAMSELAASDTGLILLWLAVLGFAMLALWQLLLSVLSRGDAMDRVKSAGKGLAYAFFAWTAFQIGRGSGESSEQQTEDFTASLMGSPGGRILVGVVGLVVLGIAGYHIKKGWTKKFLQDLREHPGDWAVHAGRIGYIAKGVALLVVGFFFLVAAYRANPEEAEGLDGALKTLNEQSFGPALLTLVAVGIAAYGIYSFARARYARV